MTRAAWGALLLLASVLLGGTARADDEAAADLALVLAVDVSRSMDLDEQQLQREGYVGAFRSEVIHQAIEKGVVGRIAVSYVEWSGPNDQKVVIPWTVIDGRAGALAFADRLASAPIGRVFSTSISGAIDFSLRHLERSGVEPLRRVIDISGDGPNNTGRSVTAARDEAVEKGIVINGLPFMVKAPTGFGDIENLDHYYEDCVIGGAGSFSTPIRDREQILDATRNKILREIADAGDMLPPIIRAQDRPKMNCMIGEQQRRQQWGP